ncbi:MAG: hypothetical protein KC619_18360 [Myxococcales bacterium]|nr:hypothetical protein [Myxococcales bacterium]
MDHDAISLLEARLEQLLHARTAIDADIELTEHLLGERRRTPLDRRWWWWPVLGAATLVTLGTLGLGLTVAVDHLLFHPEPHSGHETTRARAATIRSAASLYVAWTPGSGCPTVDDLLREGFLQDGSDLDDGWGHPYWIECDLRGVTVRSCRFDGHDVLERHSPE